jgi:hypothetical protein
MITLQNEHEIQLAYSTVSDFGIITYGLLNS